MIQLYKPGNRDFDFNGDHTLHPTSCELSMEINGTWEITLNNPIDKDLNETLVENAILSVNTPIGKKQLFIVNDINKTDTNITANAVPIFFSSDHYLFDMRAVNKNGQETMDVLFQNSEYTGHSDIETRNTAYFEEMNLIKALNGNQDNSFISRWGGEALYKNYDVYINKRIGVDNGFRAEFGLNMTGVNVAVDMAQVITRIRPKAYNGYMLPSNETVDSPNISNYYPRKFPPVVREYNDIKLKEDAFEDDEANGVTICNNLDELYVALRERAMAEFTENHVDMPAMTYNISIADVSKTETYKDFSDLAKVSLGDTVHCKYKPLNIVTDQRVIYLRWDCINESIIDLTLGDYEPNYFDNISDSVSSIDKVINKGDNTVMGDKIAGIINLLNTSLRAQKNVAQKQDVRAILFEDLDINSPTFGALCIGTQGIQISKKRNPEDTDWVWGTAINFETVVADYIIAGILSDKLGNNSWNLDTGQLKTKNMVAVNGTFSGKIESSAFEGGSININDVFIVDENGKVTITKDADINGKITSNLGVIGGWNINANGLYKDAIQINSDGITNIYTWADLYTIRLIIEGVISADEDMVAHYDFDGDGQIRSLDYVLLKNRLKAL